MNTYCNLCEETYKKFYYENNHKKFNNHMKNLLESKSICENCKKKKISNENGNLFKKNLCIECYNSSLYAYNLSLKHPCHNCNKKKIDNKKRDLDNKVYCNSCLEIKETELLSNSNVKIAEYILELRNKIKDLEREVKILRKNTNYNREDLTSLEDKVLDITPTDDYNSFY